MYRSEYTEQCKFQISNFCHFCVAQTPKYSALKFCKVVVYIIENVHNFFQIFLKLLNMFFEFFKIVGSLELGSQSNFPHTKQIDMHIVFCSILRACSILWGLTGIEVD